MHIFHSIVRELVRSYRGTITDKDEDEDGIAPLHQVCINRHTGVAKVLVDADAEVEARCVCMRVCHHFPSNNVMVIHLHVPSSPHQSTQL